MQLVRRCFEAWERRRIEVVDELMHPDCELDLTARVLNPDRYVGAEGLRRFVAELDELWESMALEPEEWIDAGDRVVIPLRARLVGRKSGLPIEDRLVQVWTVRDGKVAHVRVLTDRAEAMRSAGLADTGAGAS